MANEQANMQGGQDFEFVDEALQARIRTAFDAVEPSPEAAARMLENLKNYETQIHGATKPIAPITLEERSASYIAQAQASLAAQAAAKVAAQQKAAAKLQAQAAIASGQAAKPGAPESEVLESAELSDAAQVVAAARNAKPSPKRKIRPWQIAVPAAAAVLLGIVVLVAGPLTGLLSAPKAATSTVETAALTEDAAMEEKLGAESEEVPNAMETVAPAEGAMSAASEASTSESTEVASSADTAATSSASSSSEATNNEEELLDQENASAKAEEDVASEAASEEAARTEDAESGSAEDAGDQGASEESTEDEYARDYTDIRVIIGEEYRLVIDSTTPADQSKLSDFIANATAYNSDETASIECAIYAMVDEEEIYLISYLGEDKYYPAHVLD